ncbi:uncharacterized protein LOC119603358 [Lucilia sericata]|uniref:uncharacterized protein LOC119603358 n=1 Tax=Lucilia sericata TaxID=13632 RepID=UPI0018A814C8|nr:uncharacterized protein LOC119603358 [Lucilia sericata]
MASIKTSPCILKKTKLNEISSKYNYKTKSKDICESKQQHSLVTKKFPATIIGNKKKSTALFAVKKSKIPLRTPSSNLQAKSLHLEYKTNLNQIPSATPTYTVSPAESFLYNNYKDLTNNSTHGK